MKKLIAIPILFITSMLVAQQFSNSYSIPLITVSAFTTNSGNPDFHNSVLVLKTNDEECAISISSNPSSGRFTLHLNGISNQKVTLSVTDIAGRNVLTTSYNKAGNSFNEDFNLKGSPDGIYIATLRCGIIKKQIKLLLL